MKWVVLLLVLVPLQVFAQSTDVRRSFMRTWMATPEVANYQAISRRDRLNWFATSTAGPISLLLTGPVSAAWGTMLDRPSDYGPHWDGFGLRYGMRLTGLSTEKAMEASLGSLWGEDPRYFRSPERGFRRRSKYVIKAALLAPYRDGSWHPAYARYAGNVGSNFLSNSWRTRGERETSDAIVRCMWGVVGDIAGNAFTEFWPDVKRKLLGK